tara:strand:+ start:201 stop:419 length:219 start_codon:yes stop_codon:yes gene_type:complete
MKHKVGTLIVANAKSSKTTVFAVVTKTYPDTKEYGITYLTHTKDEKSQWNSGTWNEKMLNAWENDYGYTFIK